MDHEGRIKEITSEVDLGKAVRKLRRSRRMTQQELAGCAGVSRGCVSGLERAAHGTSISGLLSVLGVLGYELDLHPRPGESDLDEYVASFSGP